MSGTPEAERSMTTYKLADGSLIGGEFTFTTSLKWFDEDGYTQPVEVVEQVWECTSERTFWQFPDPWDCERCGEAATAWWQTPDGEWIQLCAEHRDRANEWMRREERTI